MLDLDLTDTSLGALWRDVVNLLGDRDVTPADYLPLCDAVLPKWDGYPGYIGRANPSEWRGGPMGLPGWRLMFLKGEQAVG